jgi:type I restriction enzyme R subunit
MMRNEAFSRVKIDAQLKDQGWDVNNSNAVRFEHALSDGTKSDYVLCDRNGPPAVVEAETAVITASFVDEKTKSRF